MHMGYNLVQGGVTVSMGLAELRQDMNSDALINQADKALYCAKRNGKNQVVVASLTDDNDDLDDEDGLHYASA